MQKQSKDVIFFMYFGLQMVAKMKRIFLSFEFVLSVLIRLKPYSIISVSTACTWSLLAF